VRRSRERRQPVRAVITEAEESIPDQLRRREIRYAAMMGLRAVCVLVAVLVTAAKVPYAMVWVSLCLVGMILLPWIAVLVANDRPPKKSSQFRSHLGGHPAPERALPPANPVIDVRPEREPRILEHRPED
jgi:Flp pilus assembly protein TadB